jgi:hypothetical protein
MQCFGEILDFQLLTRASQSDLVERPGIERFTCLDVGLIDAAQNVSDRGVVREGGLKY